MRHTGSDLHTRALVVTTVDGTGQPVRTARLRTTRTAVTQHFAALGAEPPRAVVESTATWSWRADHVRAASVDLTRGHSKSTHGDPRRHGEDRRGGRRAVGAAAPVRPDPGGPQDQPRVARAP